MVVDGGVQVATAQEGSPPERRAGNGASDVASSGGVVVSVLVPTLTWSPGAGCS